jgi:hypothetical protein
MNEDIRWAILRLMSGSIGNDDETIDGELDLDDFQLWFRRHPEHPEHMQCCINLSGAQWEAIKDLPTVIERTAPQQRTG